MTSSYFGGYGNFNPNYTLFDQNPSVREKDTFMEYPKYPNNLDLAIFDICVGRLIIHSRSSREAGDIQLAINKLIQKGLLREFSLASISTQGLFDLTEGLLSISCTSGWMFPYREIKNFLSEYGVEIPKNLSDFVDTLNFKEGIK